MEVLIGRYENFYFQFFPGVFPALVGIQDVQPFLWRHDAISNKFYCNEKQWLVLLFLLLWICFSRLCGNLENKVFAFFLYSTRPPVIMLSGKCSVQDKGRIKWGHLWESHQTVDDHCLSHPSHCWCHHTVTVSVHRWGSLGCFAPCLIRLHLLCNETVCVSLCNQPKKHLTNIYKWKLIIISYYCFSWFHIYNLIQYVSLVSHVLFAVIYEDPDENFNPALFKVPLHLNGSFKLPNMVFTDELLTLSSSESQDRARQLEKKVWLFLYCCL